MITDYTIDSLYPRIQDLRSREYFDEVLSCFYSGNYRSAVVMLYSVAVCDIIFKLQRLKDIYQDQAASDILSTIDTMQTQQPFSPQWENTLRDECVAKRRIILQPEASHLENLQKDWHLCAHPVVKNNAELHRPSRATVYAHIINVLGEILCRPAFLEKDLLMQILSDINQQRELLTKVEDVRQYVGAKYLDRLNSPEIETRLALKLWKFVFKLDDEEASVNRGINYRLLRVLTERNAVTFVEGIKGEPEKYSNQVKTDDVVILRWFVLFLNGMPDVYEALTEPFRLILERTLQKRPRIGNISFYRHRDLRPYFEKLLKNLDTDNQIDYIMWYIGKKLGKEEAMRVPIALLAQSGSFNEATDIYSKYVKPRLNEFTIGNLRELLDTIKNNEQARYSWTVEAGFPTIKSTVTKLDPGFDFSPYKFIK